jgi:hypothetical protein
LSALSSFLAASSWDFALLYRSTSLSTWLFSFASFFFVAATDGLGAASAGVVGMSTATETARAARVATWPERRYRECEVATG